MKNCVLVLAASLCASACVGAPAPTLVPTASVAGATASPTSAVTRTLTASARPVAYRVMSSVPGRATVSPDGRWIVAPDPRAASPMESVQLFTIDGTFVRALPEGVFWSWLPDSSGFFAAVLVPQRAPPLWIVELDGRAIATELQLAHQTLSRDGTLIVAEHQEGCCASIVQREIRVARRDGSGTRTLVTSQMPPSEPHTVALLGVDASDRAIYRDGAKIMRTPLAGGRTTTLGAAPEYARVIPGNTSPDGAAVLARGYEPARWVVIANDRVTAWDDSLGSIVEDGNPGLTKTGAAPLWVGPRTVLARDQAGLLALVDAVTSVSTPQAGRLLSGDVVLAHHSGTLLILRGGVVVLLDLRSGAVRDTGLDLRPDSGGAHGAALPSGGFALSSLTGTYRID